MFKTLTIDDTLVITTEESPAGPGRHVTTVVNKATDTLIDGKRSGNEADALQDFNDMLVKYVLPLQRAVCEANMEKGKRYTLVTMSDFGFPVAVQFTFDHMTLEHYAQYDDNVTMYYTPKNCRNMRYIHLHNNSFAIYGDWRELDDGMKWNVVSSGKGVVSMVGKYASFDEKFIEDILKTWPDHIASYRREQPAQEAKQPEPTPDPDPQAFESREIAPGLTLMCDAEHGLYVDTSPEIFASMYADPPKDLPAEERLIRALRRATVACMSHAKDEDGGTCNFDSPTLDYKTCGMTRDAAERSIKAVGLSCYDWEKQLVITGCFYGQGNRRTKMARAFSESMTNDGVAAGMYYQMD